jgi:hypothetical protein
VPAWEDENAWSDRNCTGLRRVKTDVDGGRFTM